MAATGAQSPPGPSSEPARDASQRASSGTDGLLDGLLGQAAAVTAATAGTVGLLYVVGGAVMWLRFHNAGLPADQAVALVPRTDLLVIGLRVMVLPAVASGVVALLLGQVMWRARESRLERLVAERDAEKRRLADLEHARSAPQPSGGTTGERNAIRERVEELAAEIRRGKEPLTVHGQLPRPRRAPVRFAALVVAAVAITIVVPLSFAALAWPIVLIGVLAYWLRLCAARDRGDGLRFPIWRLAAAAVIAGGFVSVARQTGPPVELPSVRAEVTEPSSLLLTTVGEAQTASTRRPKTLVVAGVLISVTDRELNLGIPARGLLAAVPRSTVAFMAIGPPLDQRAPPRSILSRVTGRSAWAVTPLELWCANLRYGWTRLTAACEAEPQIRTDPELRIVKSTVSGLRIDCPAEADRSCAGFVRLTTLQPGLQGSLLQRVETAPTAFVTDKDSTGRPVIRVDNDALWEQLEAAPSTEHCRAARRDVCVDVHVRVSLDQAGHAVLSERESVLRLSAPPAADPKRKPRLPPSSGGGGDGTERPSPSAPPANPPRPPARTATPTPVPTESPAPTVTPDTSDPLPPADQPIQAPTPVAGR